MNESEKKKTVSELKDLYKKLKSYKSFVESEDLTESQKRYVESLREKLVSKSGVLKETISELTGKQFYEQFGRAHDIWSTGLSRSDYLPPKLTALGFCIDAVNEAIGKLEAQHQAIEESELEELFEESERATRKPGKAVEEPPKAFIAHGPKSQTLDKLCRFLTALGVKPLVIEQEPYKSRSVNEQVEFHLKEADCAVVLGTADDKEAKDGKLYPRRNVHIEIGRFQERFPDRTIYLLEENASFPSNIMEKLHARFTPECMDEALIRVAIELKAFGLINASKPDMEK